MAARRWKKWLLWLLLAVACYVAVVYACIVWQSNRDESRRTDIMVVFGAAQYDGRPSPVYKARLDHAAQLYHRGLAGPHGQAGLYIPARGGHRTGPHRKQP